MNDASEFHLQIDLLKRCLEREIKRSGLRESVNWMLPIYSFVACFCSDPDLLSQWRGYSGANYGYAIGFRSSAIKKIIENLSGDQNVAIGKCIYDAAIQLDIVRRLVDHFLSGEYCDWESGDLLSIVLADLFKVGLFFKDESFRSEQEWRIITFQPQAKRVSFRQGTSTIIPYVDIPVSQNDCSAIDHICVGPCPHMDLSVSALDMLMRRYELWHRTESGGLEIDARRSTIPFRNW
ncbi:MAG TPA: DUF2971 domain-containing protein [Acetobacteraceae bacterium]|nr:DUF2971 domain-containing protein [Acetobacteraceae bacterium]